MSDAKEIRKIFNLFESVSAPQEQLDEDLGNLKDISPSLMSVFRAYTMGRGKGPLKPSVGQNSPVTVQDVKSATAIIRTLEDDKNVIGAVLVVGGKQVFAVAVHERKYSGITFKATVDVPALQSVVGETNVTSEDFSYGGKLDFRNTGGDSSNKIRAGVSHILSLAKQAGLSYSSKVVSQDAARAEVSKDRKAARVGATAMMTKDQLRKEFASTLRSKLEAFKAGKATSVEDFDQAIEKFKTDFLEMITIAGYSYKISNANLNWSYLKSEGEDGWGRSSISYEATQETNQKIWDLRRGYKEKFPGKDYDDPEVAAYLGGLPPKNFEVIVKLKGNVLTPVKLKKSEY